MTGHRDRVLLMLLMLLMGTSPGQAAVPAGAAEGFLEGNRLYEEEQYSEAVGAYARVLEMGVSAPELEYNLGNAYLKAGETGSAILHFRRALRLRGRYESARLNLAYARSLTQDVKPDSEPQGGWSWISRLRLGIPAGAMLLFLTACFIAVVAILRLRRWRDRIDALVLQAFLGGCFLLVVTALLFEWTQQDRREGVVIQPQVDVRAGPAESNTVSFRLHEGTEVEIVRETHGWQEIRVSDRLQGWAPEGTVAEI